MQTATIDALLQALGEPEILWLVRALANGGKLRLLAGEALDPSIATLLRGGYLYACATADDRIVYQVTPEGAELIGLQ